MSLTRISEHDAIEIFRSEPLIHLSQRATEYRNHYNAEGEVTFIIDTNPNYTNVCLDRCTFCSFYRNPKDPEGYLNSIRHVVDGIQDASKQGATTVLLQGGHNPDVGMEYIESLVLEIRRAVPEIHIHPFSPSEIIHFARVEGTSQIEVLARLWDLGVDTMPGGGAEILNDRVKRRISPKKISADQWLSVMRDAHKVGMKTSATMMYGHIETDEEILEHLIRLRELQDETGGFYAFIPWSFKEGSSPLSRMNMKTSLVSRYARVIALSRIVLDNFPHIQASWFGEGWRAGQIALHCGADDFGGTLLEENVLFSADHKVSSNLESVVSVISDAGFIPVQRTTKYEHLRRYTPEEFANTGEPVFERKSVDERVP